MSFPLYDILYSSSTSDDLSKEEKLKCIKNISEMDEKQHENIFTIIRIYGLRNRDDTPQIFELPYKSTYVTGTQNIKFNLEELPNKLLRMLLNFIEMNRDNKY